jgi:hypothetical protein
MILSLSTPIVGSLLTLFSALLQRFLVWWKSKPAKDVYLANLREAREFKEWEEAALKLDEALGYDLWYVLY